MADTLDPQDVGALEKAVNDSAGRVSTIWISFLVFGLYLAVAAGGVTHRQLLLEDAIKLPVLNIDLPLVSFFFLAPLLFAIFHVYVLMQVILLARTAAAYNEALDRRVASPADRGVLRQRLVNTLFAQIFAGSPREREGLLGLLLRLMAWVTLAIAPVMVLLTIEVRFLPYHSALVTWTHRALIVLDLAALLLLWRGALAPQRDITWGGLFAQRSAAAMAALLALASVVVVTYPGEPHTSWMRFGDARSPICRDWLGVRLFEDRLLLSDEVLIDRDKFAKLAAAEPTADKTEPPRRFVARDLACASFADADLRGADFSGETSLRGAILSRARLDLAKLNDADLREAILTGARLDAATLADANARGARLASARLRGADLNGTDLSGADLSGAYLQGADLGNASLERARLRNARLHGAILGHADLTKADFRQAQLQGASFERTTLKATDFTLAYLWHAQLFEEECESVILDRARFEKTINVTTVRGGARPPAADGDVVEAFIQDVVHAVPEATRHELDKALGLRLRGATDEQDSRWQAAWHACARKPSPEKAKEDKP
jgi:uncharacterized protein YjbI with pentapeptide repeats